MNISEEYRDEVRTRSVDNVSDAEALEGEEWPPWSGTCAGRDPGGLSSNVAKEDQNGEVWSRGEMSSFLRTGCTFC